MSFLADGMQYDKEFNSYVWICSSISSSRIFSCVILVYKAAFEKADSFDKDKVRDALAQTDMQTFYGNIKFSDTGQNIAKPMVLFQVRCEGDECANRVVAPTKWASHELVHPIPSWSSR